MQLESLIYILYTYLITIYMYKSNKYLNFHGCGKKNHYYNNHLCVYPIILYKKVTYISIHMGTKKTKKITIIIFNLSSQSAKAIMISRDWSFVCFLIMPILTISTTMRCALILSTRRNSYFPWFSYWAPCFRWLHNFVTNMIRYYPIYFISNWINTL